MRFGAVVWVLFLCLSACLCEEGISKRKDNVDSKSERRGKQAYEPGEVGTVFPTYAYEFRSSNPKDTKFTSGGVYQAYLPEIDPKGASVKCDLKMGVYSYNESAKIDFIIVGGNELNAFRTGPTRRVRDFVFMDIVTIADLNRETVKSYLLTVIARDSESLVTLDSTQVKISILDTNDNRPQFTRLNLTYIATVPEDIPLHTSIAKLEAQDADSGPNGLLYYSFKDKTSYFAINPITGVITVTSPLSSSKKYTLRVIARDRALPRSRSLTSDTCSVHINVRSVNKFPPTIRIKSLMDNITEGTTGIVYAEVEIVDKDNAENGQVDKLVITSGNEERKFAVKRSTKPPNVFLIEVVRPLDHEEKPHGYNLDLTAFDKGSPPRNSSISIRVVTVDVSDMKPEFNQSKYAARISELAPPQTSVIRVFALDGDSGANAEITYAIFKGNDAGKFDIDTKTGLISTKAGLDYEQEKRFDLLVTAMDGGPDGTRKWSTVQVLVEVEDANDMDPVFTQSSYEKVLYEGMAGGDKILTVIAKDGDSGENGRVHYHITNPEPLPFVIDQITGTISTSAELNRDTGLPEFITIKVRASDFGTPLRREAEAYVHVTVKSRNNNPPMFKQYSCDIRVSERAPVGTVITAVMAVDIDVGVKRELMYRISSGDSGKLFQIGEKSGVVKTRSNLQGVQRKTFFLEVLDGIWTSTSAVTLNVQVVSAQDARQFFNFVQADCKDNPDYAKATELIQRQKSFKPSLPLSGSAPQKPANKHHPRFIHHRAVFSLREDTPVGTAVVKLTAVDLDQGYNGLVVYSIMEGNVDCSFVINMFTGEVSTVAPLDREKNAEYNFNIVAFDRGDKAKSTNTTVKISVLDVNDNPPVFDKNVYEVSLFENVTIGQTVIQVQASDVDESSNGIVKYQLADDFGKFWISEDGTISIMASLDYEEQSSYEIHVQATDSSPTLQKMATTVVRVKLVDINDTPPLITPKVLKITIPEDIPPESLVTSIRATDPDGGQGGRLIYSILTGDRKFKIHEKSGVIRLKRRVSYRTQSVYNITVKVMDYGSPSLHSFAYVIVTLANLNKNSLPPIFKNGRTVLRGSVSENKPAGVNILTVKADDVDSWVIKYALIDGTGIDKFTVNPDTGVLSTTKELDHEEADHYWLMVQAKDGEDYPLYANIQILITVLDVTDEEPYFNPTVYYPSVLENKSPGASVVRVMAHDPNSAHPKLIYSIIDGNRGGLFSIDQTGLITTTGPLDREEKDKHILSVQVEDSSTPPKTASISFTVTVADANDNAPVFTESSFDAYLLKPSKLEQSLELICVVATDEDIGTNADLTYVISKGDEYGKLFIDPKTGVISTSQMPTLYDVFDLIVNVTDGGSPPNFADVSVYIAFDDENQPNSKPPQFTSQKVDTVSLNEDAKVNDFVVGVTAEDPGDIILYSIVSGNIGTKFWIDSHQGLIKLAGKLDREQQSRYVLKVQATDGYNTAMATINVIVLDVNDNAPQPVMMEYQAHVAEDAKPGSVVTRVEGNFELSPKYLDPNSPNLP